jgi:hypothetical protein
MLPRDIIAPIELRRRSPTNLPLRDRSNRRVTIDLLNKLLSLGELPKSDRFAPAVFCDFSIRNGSRSPDQP